MNSVERRGSSDAIGLAGLRPLGIALALAVAAGSTIGALGGTFGRDFHKLRLGDGRWVLTFVHVSQRDFVYDKVTGSVLEDGALRVCVHDVWLPVTGVGVRGDASVLCVGPLEIAAHEVRHFLETAEYPEASDQRLSPACAPWSEFTLSSSEVASRG